MPDMWYVFMTLNVYFLLACICRNKRKLIFRSIKLVFIDRVRLSDRLSACNCVLTRVVTLCSVPSWNSFNLLISLNTYAVCKNVTMHNIVLKLLSLVYTSLLSGSFILNHVNYLLQTSYVHWSLFISIQFCAIYAFRAIASSFVYSYICHGLNFLQFILHYKMTSDFNGDYTCISFRRILYNLYTVFTHLILLEHSLL